MTHARPEDELRRVRLALSRIGGEAAGLDVFARRCATQLQRVVAFDEWSVAAVDPDYGLPTFVAASPGLPRDSLQEALEYELFTQDFNHFRSLSASHRPLPVGILSNEAEGDVTRSVRHERVLVPLGLVWELRAALITNGETWGTLALLRREGRSDFTQRDAAAITHLGSTLASGIIRTLARTSHSPDAGRGVVVIATTPSGLGRFTANPVAVDYMRRIDPEGAALDLLPTSLYAISAEALLGDGASAARVVTRAGVFTIMADVLEDGRIYTTITAGHHHRDLFLRSRGITDREFEIARLYARGISYQQIADSLDIATKTVDSHLTNLRRKIGAASTREALWMLLFDGAGPPDEGGLPSPSLP